MKTYTPRAQQAINRAVKEAEQRGDKHLGAEHLLLGLAALYEGPAAAVLQRRKLSYKAAHEALEREKASEVRPAPKDGLSEVVKLAEMEATALNHSYVGGEHLLLALLKDSEREHAAARVLKALPLTYDQLREEILQELEKMDKSPPNAGAKSADSGDREDEAEEDQRVEAGPPTSNWGNISPVTPSDAKTPIRIYMVLIALVLILSLAGFLLLRLFWSQLP